MTICLFCFSGSGEVESGVDVLPYTDAALFISQSNTTCVSIPREILHGDLHVNHDYYVVIKASSAAGLSVMGESPVFTEITNQPSGGVVLDILPANEQSSSDTKVMTNITRISKRQITCLCNLNSYQLKHDNHSYLHLTDDLK